MPAAEAVLEAGEAAVEVLGAEADAESRPTRRRRPANEQCVQTRALAAGAENMECPVVYEE